jgi:hypothetical protein
MIDTENKNGECPSLSYMPGGGTVAYDEDSAQEGSVALQVARNA